MSVETSNAPRELWVPIRRSDGRTGRARTDRDDALVFAAVDIGDSPTEWTAELYLRADLVVPTARELWDLLYGIDLTSREALVEQLHERLLSRIEGDNEAGQSMVYDGSFELSFLRADEQVGSAGDGTGAVIVESERDGEIRVDVGDTVTRTKLGDLTVTRAAAGGADHAA